MNSDAYNAALRRLTVREYSSSELAAYLEKKGFTPEETSEVIAALVRRKFLDDGRYVRAVVRYQAGRGKGPAYIGQKLKQKGVRLGTSEIKEVLNEVAEKSELETAREVIERRYPGYKSDRAIAIKAIQALLRRGFSYDIARQAVSNKELAEND